MKKEFKMRMESYPAIGQKVNFVRQNLQDGEIVTGRGTILAICLDATKRLVAHIECVSEKEGQPVHEKFNIDFNCLNPSDEFLEKFKSLTDEIKKISQEGNEKAGEIVREYNTMVEGFYSDLLGAPVELEQ